MAGRFAPSPTGALHLGSLRTALAAWLAARASGRSFVVRIEDLDRAAGFEQIEQSQLDDLVAVGIEWDGPVVLQRHRHDAYEAALAALQRDDLVYPCFCTRAEIRRAVAAPHGDEVVYPGTCRRLDAATVVRRSRERQPALRLRADPTVSELFDDLVVGPQQGAAHDVVLRRNDGAPAYNLAVVVDDAFQGVDQIVRGRDLLTITPTQLALHRALGLTPPAYGHVPLVVGDSGQRLAKRDGAISLSELAAAGRPPGEVTAALLRSLGVDGHSPRPWDGFRLAAERRRGPTIDASTLFDTAVGGERR